jgi:hypothetical protein
MKTLNIQIDDSLLEMLKKIPKSKIKIQELDSTNDLSFEQATNYALEKNKELYKRLS